LSGWRDGKAGVAHESVFLCEREQKVDGVILLEGAVKRWVELLLLPSAEVGAVVLRRHSRRALRQRQQQHRRAPYVLDVEGAVSVGVAKEATAGHVARAARSFRLCQGAWTPPGQRRSHRGKPTPQPPARNGHEATSRCKVTQAIAVVVV